MFALSAFEEFRPVVMGAGIIAVRGRVQREGEVVHIVANRLTNLSAEIASKGNGDEAFPRLHGRGDQAVYGGGLDPREAKAPKIRETYITELHIGRLMVKSQNSH
jgi:error-prone DNA polymerase